MFIWTRDGKHTIVGKCSRKQKKSDSRTSQDHYENAYKVRCDRYQPVAHQKQSLRRSFMHIPTTMVLQPPNHKDVLPRTGPLDNTLGGPRTETRSVTQTALREAHGQILGQNLNTSLELRSKLPPLYRVAHIRCQLYGRASPSRTRPYQRLDNL